MGRFMSSSWLIISFTSSIPEWSFQTTWASLFEMELEPNLLDWNVNELERQFELDDMKCTSVGLKRIYWSIWNSFWIKNC